MAADQYQDYILVYNPLYSKRTVECPPGETACLSQLKLKLTQWRDIKARSLLRSMAASIDQEGLFNPLFGIQVEEGLFVVCGTRRLVCCKWLNLKKIPSVIVDYTGKWSNFEELRDQQAIFSKFRDPPQIFTMDDKKVYMDKLADSEAYTLR